MVSKMLVTSRPLNSGRDSTYRKDSGSRQGGPRNPSDFDLSSLDKGNPLKQPLSRRKVDYYVSLSVLSKVNREKERVVISYTFHECVTVTVACKRLTRTHNPSRGSRDVFRPPLCTFMDPSPFTSLVVLILNLDTGV